MLRDALSLLEVADEVLYLTKKVSVPLSARLSDPTFVRSIDPDEIVQWLEQNADRFKRLKQKRRQYRGYIVLEIPYYLWKDLADRFGDPRSALTELVNEYLLRKLRQTERKGRGYYVCPVCGSHDVIPDVDSGYYVCRNCGYVIEEQLTTAEDYVDTESLQYVDGKSLMSGRKKQIFLILSELLPNMEQKKLYQFADFADRLLSCLTEEVDRRGLRLKKTKLSRLQWILKAIAIAEALKGLPNPPSVEQIVSKLKSRVKKGDAESVKLTRELLKDVIEKCVY